MAIIELTPTTGDYLTQSTLSDEESRIFVKKIAGCNINSSDWKDATEEDKTTWEVTYRPIDEEID